MLFIIVISKVYERRLALFYLIALFFAFPIAVNVAYIMYPGHPLSTASICLVLLLIFPLVILEKSIVLKIKKRIITILACWILIPMFAVSLYGNILHLNQVYLKAYYVQQHGMTFSTTLITRIKSVEGFSSSHEVLFIGRYPVKPSTVPAFNRLASRGLEPVPAMWSFNQYLRFQLGFEQHITLMWHHLPADHPFADYIMEMPLYPESGSIRLLGNQMVVKFSHVTLSN